LRLRRYQRHAFQPEGSPVAFESDGGSRQAGIRMGEFIRQRGFVTVVPTGARCESACAIAWLVSLRSLVRASVWREGNRTDTALVPE
jgi:hypothetical protein